MPPRKQKNRVPTKQEVLHYIEDSPVPIGKKELARAFNLKGDDRLRLRALLKELKEEGWLGRKQRKEPQKKPLAEVIVVRIVGVDEDGELYAHPDTWREEWGAPPIIYMLPGRFEQASLDPNDRALVRIKEIAENAFEGHTIRRITRVPKRILGVYYSGKKQGSLKPVDRKSKHDFLVSAGDAGGAKDGELVFAETKQVHARPLKREVRIVERVGGLDTPNAYSLISLHEHEIPLDFSRPALDETESLEALVDLGDRSDLREMPLVTIDGADARDFDDAVFAEADKDPKNPGGWHMIVAIADVAYYVEADGHLDRNAQERGNSVYFPDRVVPMLPTRLSNNLCSLVPNEVRACLAVHMWIDENGNKLRHRFERGLMRSAARLTYEQVQAAYEGRPDETTSGIRDDLLAPLYGAYTALLKARAARGTLDLDVEEQQVFLTEKGHIDRIRPRHRLDSHRLIEEFMIIANVAAAEQLEKSHTPCMYRVHEPPNPLKVEALRDVLEPLGLTLARGQVIKPLHFEKLLLQVKNTANSRLVSDLVLRSQSQAYYSPENRGHFGLALQRYAHFTSPIRRYADLLVHRALISALNMGEDGLPPIQRAKLTELAEQISTTERRAISAERDTLNRLVAKYLEEKIGARFMGRITGVTRFGLFVRLEDTGAEGLIPMSNLPQDMYRHLEKSHQLLGQKSKRIFTLGDPIEVELMEAVSLTGGIIFQFIENGNKNGHLETKPKARQKQKRPASKKHSKISKRKRDKDLRP